MEIQMKGQEKAARQASLWIESFLCKAGRSPVRPALLHGPAGCGKSHLVTLMGAIVERAGIDVIALPSATEIFRTISSAEEVLLPILERDKPALIVLDEAQAMAGGSGLSGAVCKGFRSALYPWGDREPQFGNLPFGRLTEININWSNLGLLLATNQPDRLEDSASLKQGQFPFRRRLSGIQLSEYGPAIIGEVIGDFLGARGLRAADCSRAMLARFHRGTLEAVDAVTRSFVSLFPGTSTLSKDKVIAAAKLTDWFPRGINRNEAKLLNLLSVGQARKETIPGRMGIEPGSLKIALGYLEGQSLDGKPAPFVRVTGTMVSITTDGHKYLDAVKRDGFTF